MKSEYAVLKVAIVGVLVMLGTSVSAQGLLGVGTRLDAKVDARVDLAEKREAKLDAKVDAKIERMEDREATRTEKLKEREEKREEKRSKFQGKQTERVVKFSTQMIKVHKAAVGRLSKLADRIDSRITKLEAEKNVKLDEAKAKLAAAKVKIDTSASYVAGISAQVDTITATGTARTVLESVRGVFATSRENLKVAHQALVDVISSIKLGLGIKADVSASTTTP